MSPSSDSDGFAPNADVLRLREYADVIAAVTDIIELVEEPRLRPGALEHDYSFEVGDQSYFIPERTVQRIDVRLSLATDVIASSAELDPNYDTEPSLEVLLDNINPTVEVYSEKRLAKVADISIYLHGSDAVYVIGRSSIEAEHTEPDHVLQRVNKKLDVREIPPVTQSDLNGLILSIVSPDSMVYRGEDPARYEVDFLRPGSFDALNQLFEGIAFANDSHIGHKFRTSDTFFKYYRVTNPVTDQPTTYYQIRFVSNEPAGNTVIVKSDMDASFKVSFSTIVDEGHSDNWEEERELGLRPYIPTLSELRYLKKLIAEETEALRWEIKSPLPTFDSVSSGLEDPRDVIAEADGKIADQQDFHGIARRAIEEAFIDIVNPLGEDK